MPVITCHNVRLDDTRQPKQCGRFLAELTDLQIDILRTDPDKRCTFRCPMCPPEQRWVEVHWDGDRLVFAATSQKPDFTKHAKFDEFDVYEQIG